MTGLVLEGGGMRGAYEVGAYLAFKKCGIKFDGVVGTSIGAFNAAMIVCNKDEALLDFWRDVDVADILGLDKELSDLIRANKINFQLIKGIAQIVKQGGIKTKKLREVMDSLFTEEELRKSKMDFGLVTVSRKGFKTIELFKEGIPEGKIKDYILASAYLPIFKKEKIIDSNLYLDGAFGNILPISMLANKNYDRIYAVSLRSFGIKKKIRNNSCKITYITPNKKLGRVLSLDKDLRLHNINLGHFDTLKVLKKLDGEDYYFRNRKKRYYNFLARNISLSKLNKIKRHFKVECTKDVIISAMEYIMKNEKIPKFKIYIPYEIISKIKRKYNKKNDFIYEFVHELKMFL